MSDGDGHPRQKKARRHCCRCRQLFLSTWAGHRYCARCREAIQSLVGGMDEFAVMGADDDAR